MNILAVLLLAISAGKLYMLITLDEKSAQYQDMLGMSIEDINKYAGLILLTDGLVGLFCALYIIFVV